MSFDSAFEKVGKLVKQLHRKCDYCYSEIDRIVYELYDLTGEVIRILQGKSNDK